MEAQGQPITTRASLVEHASFLPESQLGLLIRAGFTHAIIRAPGGGIRLVGLGTRAVP